MWWLTTFKGLTDFICISSFTFAIIRIHLSVHSGCYNKISQGRWLKQQTCISQCLEYGKSNTKVLADFLSSEGLLPVFQIGAFLYLHMASPWCKHVERERDSDFSFF